MPAGTTPAPSRINSADHLASPAWPARLRFRAALALRGLFSASRAWRHALAFDHLTTTAAQSLRAAGLPDQSTCRNRAGLTPLEAVPLPGQGRRNADTIDHCIGALTTSAHATRLAAAPAVARPRRRS